MWLKPWGEGQEEHCEVGVGAGRSHGNRVWLKPWGEGQWEHCEVGVGAWPAVGPTLLAPAAPGCSSYLLSPAAIWGGSLTRGAFISSYIKQPLDTCAKQRLLEPINHAGSLWKMLLPPWPHHLPPLLRQEALHLWPPPCHQNQ